VQQYELVSSRRGQGADDALQAIAGSVEPTSKVSVADNSGTSIPIVPHYHVCSPRLWKTLLQPFRVPCWLQQRLLCMSRWMHYEHVYVPE
jgi:hypothetical protein